MFDQMIRYLKWTYNVNHQAHLLSEVSVYKVNYMLLLSVLILLSRCRQKIEIRRTCNVMCVACMCKHVCAYAHIFGGRGER